MAASELCTRDEVARLVHTFYASVRRDEVLGPIFNRHVEDWDAHLATLVEFWSALLRRTGRFTGTPMPKHIALPGLSAELFQRWLHLFRETTAAQPNRAMAEAADLMAGRIAQTLWYGYQLSHQPDGQPTALAHG